MTHAVITSATPAQPGLRWYFWVLALGLTSAEWLVPMSYWGHAALTLVSVVLLPVWAYRAWRMLGNAERRGDARSTVGNWTLRSLLLLCILYFGSQITKAWFLRDLWLRNDPASIVPAYRSFVLVAFFTNGLVLGMRPRPFERLLLAIADHTARLVSLTFGGAILIGAFLLMLPVSVRNFADISAVDALFTSASAVCVTGLVVNQVARTYTFFGQAVILALIQIGGLGIMVLYGAVVSLAGRRMSTRSARMMTEVIDVDSLSSVRRLLWGILGFTFAVEALGALGLYYALLPHSEVANGFAADLPKAGAGSVAWAAIFHAISAYCNAGFSLFRDGIVPFAGSWLVSGLLMFLVVAGGLGFPVWFELLGQAWKRARRQRPDRLSLHSRVVLAVTSTLLVVGTLMFLVLEWSHSMRGLPWLTKVLTAAFQSVISRTAGFNSLDFAAMTPATWLGTCVLMYIGASPGSTGGGVKTTTMAVLIAATWADLRGGHKIELWRRSISDASARRAVGVTLISTAVVIVVTFALLLTERFDALRLLFETISALATVGLSTGITPELSTAGKLIIALAMYLGRIGPLTLALALATHRTPHSIGLPEERIGIG
ncbi:MAG: potassium transporter TrkG [Polyangiaceae bacterium]